MRLTKKIVSLSLAFALILSIFAPIGEVFAADTQDEAKELEGGQKTEYEYFVENVDEKYVAVRQFKQENIIIVKQTLAEKKLLPSGKIDDLWESTESAAAFISMYENPAIMYDVDPDSDYYVSRINTMYDDEGCEVTDVIFAMNDNAGTEVDGCIYDYNTGLAYIPKSLLIAEDGVEEILSLQVQLLQLCESAEPETTIDVTVKEDVLFGEDSQTSQVTLSATDVGTSIQIMDTNKADSISAEDITVKVNGSDGERDDAVYDEETGEIALPISPASIDSIEVSISKENTGILGGLFAPIVAHAGLHNGTSSLYTEGSYSADKMAYLLDKNGSKIVLKMKKGTPKEGDKISAKVAVLYGSSQTIRNKVGTNANRLYGVCRGDASHTLDSTESLSSPKSDYGQQIKTILSESTDEAVDWFSDASKDKRIYRYKTEKGGITFAMHAIADKDGKTTLDTSNDARQYTVKTTGWAPLLCAHVSRSVTNIGSSGTFDVNVVGRVLKVDTADNYVIMAFATKDTMGGQTGTGIFKFKYEAETTPIQIQKSTVLELENASGETQALSYSQFQTMFPNQDLSGITFKVAKGYTDGALKNVVATKKTKANGKTEKFELEAGIYYVKESALTTKTFTDKDGNVWTMKRSASEAGVTRVEDGETKDFGVDSTATWNGSDVQRVAKVASNIFKIVVVNNPDATYIYKFTDPLCTSNDPVQILLQKVDEDGKVREELEGAQYTIKFYEGEYTEDPAESGETAKYEWVFETDEDGWIFFDPDHFISGESLDSFRDSGTAAYMLPNGTITIQETLAPQGFYLDPTVYTLLTSSITSTVMATNTATPAVISRETEGKGGVEIQKRDIETMLSTPQGDGTFAGATFDIQYAGEEPKVINGKTVSYGDVVATLTTDENGYASTEALNISLPEADYLLVETAAPGGYKLENSITIRVFSVVTGETTSLTDIDEAILDAPIRGGFKLQKRDWETFDDKAQGDAEIAPITFTITNKSSHPVTVLDLLPVSGTSQLSTEQDENGQYAPGSVIATCTTDEKGYFESLSNWLPYGTYEITETTSPTGYVKNGPNAEGSSKSSKMTRTFTIRKDDEVVDSTLADADTASMNGENDSAINSNTAFFDLVKRGGFKIQKRDWETFGDDPQGDASFSSMQFEIWNRSSKRVKVVKSVNAIKGTIIMADGADADGCYATDRLICTITTDEKGYFESTGSFLPYGSYSIREVIAPTGYDKKTSSEDNADMNGRNSEGSEKKSIVERQFHIGYELSSSGERKELDNETVVDLTSEDAAMATYNGENDTYTVKVNGQNVKITEAELYRSFYDLVDRGGFKWQKRDWETFDSSPMGGASFANITFTITNKSAGRVKVTSDDINSNIIAGSVVKMEKPDEDGCYASGALICTCKTDDKGYFESTSNFLPYGTYYIEETVMSKGYKLRNGEKNQSNSVAESTADDSEVKIRQTFEIRKDEEMVDLTNNTKASLIINGSTVNTDIYGTYFNLTEETNNDQAKARQYGTSSTGFDADGNRDYSSLNQPGSWENNNYGTENENYLTMINSVIRGDFEIRKIDGNTQKTMAGVRFQVTSDTTGESHCFTTDKNGEYRSTSPETIDRGDDKESYSADYILHSHNTNGGAAGDGLWFGTTKNGVKAPVDDTLGALPYDKYTIVELPCESNGYEKTNDKTMFVDETGQYWKPISGEAKSLWCDKFTVSRDHQIVYLNNIENYDLPDMSSLLSGNLSGSVYKHFVTNSEDATATDTVSLSNLTKLDGNGKPYVYRLVGTLVDFETGTVIGYKDKAVSVTSDEFTYKQKDGAADGGFSKKIEQTFYFDATKLQGATIVATEVLQIKNSSGEWQTIAEERLDTLKADPEELKNQSLYVPGIGTLAFGKDTNDHITCGTGKVRITDTVSYKNLPGHTKYTITGTLMKKSKSADGKITSEVVKDVSGNMVTASATFTAPDEIVTSGTQKVIFEFDAPKGLAGNDLVLFEKITHGNDVISTHEDIGDNNQTVHLPEIKTTATDKETKEHLGITSKANTGSTTTLKDTVAYNNLIPGRIYKLRGTLMVKSTGEPLKNASGAAITAEKQFAAAFESGTEELEFNIDSSLLAGETVVVYENLYYNEVEVAAHADIEDEDQSVHFPKIGTTATDENTNDHVGVTKSGDHAEATTIKDIVAYKNLIPGRKYNLQGTLMVKSTGEVLKDGTGNEITAKKEFTPAKSDGSEELEFKVDSRLLADETVVAFERLYYNDIEIAVHADITDEDQSVHFPKIGTTAADVKSETHAGEVSEKAKVKDVVSYKNLIIGKEYTVKGTLMRKDTGKAVIGDDGKEVTAEKTFTAEKSDGKVELVFDVDSEALEGATAVVFENLYYGDVIVASHADIEDEDQSVHYPSMGTTATVDGKKKVKAEGMVTVKDVVAYKNLIPDHEYTVKGVLMDKDSGKKLSVGSKTITSEATFTPKKESGKVDVLFTFNADGLDGKTLVVFETMYVGKADILYHNDIGDEAQTVFIGDTSGTPKTGDVAKRVLLGLGLVAFGAGMAVLIRRRRKITM